MLLTKPKVSIVLLNRQSNHQPVLECIHALKHLTYPNLDIILVDSFLTPDVEVPLYLAYPAIKLLPLTASAGAAAGHNVGIRYALQHRADYTLLLSHETIAAPDMVDLLVETLEQNQRLAACGPLVYYYDDPEVIWSAAGVIDWRTGDSHLLGLNEQDRGQFGDKPRNADFVPICAMLVRTSAWGRIGLLDEDFGVLYEETEWSVRAWRAGYSIALVPNAMLWRKRSFSFWVTSPQIYYYMTRNRLLFLHKTHASMWVWLRMWLMYLRTFVSWSVRPAWRNRRRLRRLMLQAVGDYYRGRLGQTLAGV